MKINDKDKTRIIDMFPSLVFKTNALKGDLNFAARFLKKQNSYELLDPNTEAPIKGTFQIFIDFSKKNPYREVYETNGKIQEIANNLKKELIDLHAKHTKEKNNYTNICIAGYLQENQEISLIKFICEVVVPYFCDLIVFEKDGYWPRGEYSHGTLGILENYSDQLMVTDNIKDLTERCIKELMEQEKDFEYLIKKKLNESWTGFNKDNPTKKFRDIIGRKAFNGLWQLKNNLKKYNLLSKIQL